MARPARPFQPSYFGASASCAPLSPKMAVRVCIKRPTAPGRLILTPAAACEALRQLASRDRESFVALHLDTRSRVIGMEEVARGHLSGVEVHPREVFKSAILNNAASVLVAHNHPSGEADPSIDDRVLTKRLADAGKLIGIPVVDHVVVGADRCFSFKSDAPDALSGPARRRRSRGRR